MPRLATMRRARSWAALAGLLALAPCALAAQPAPALVFDAPPGLEPVARELRALPSEALLPAMRLAGLSDPGPPIRVVLAPEDSELARSVPRWITGFADGGRGVAVLFPERVPRYPDRSLASLLQHEVAHVLVARAAGGRPLPRWFNEGLAMAAGRGPGLEDRARVALAVLVRGQVGLARIDAAFAAGEAAVERAYALSEDFVRELVRRHGAGFPAAVLAEVAIGAPFEEAFARTAGESLAAAEESYWRRRTFWNRWLPLLTSSAALWAGVTLLALAAFRRRRARDAQIHGVWEEEERREALEETGGDGPGQPR